LHHVSRGLSLCLLMPFISANNLAVIDVTEVIAMLLPGSPSSF